MSIRLPKDIYSFSEGDLQQWMLMGNREKEILDAAWSVELFPEDMDGYLEFVSLLYGMVLNPTYEEPKIGEGLAWYCLKMIEKIEFSEQTREREIQRIRLKYAKATLMLVLGEFCGAYDLFRQIPWDAERFLKENGQEYLAECVNFHIASELNIHQIKVLTGNSDEEFFEMDKNELGCIDGMFEVGLMKFQKDGKITFAEMIPKYSYKPNPFLAGPGEGYKKPFGICMALITCLVEQGAISVQVEAIGSDKYKGEIPFRVWQHKVPEYLLEKTKSYVDNNPYSKPYGLLREYITKVFATNEKRSHYELEKKDEGWIITKYTGFDTPYLYVPSIICGRRIHGIGNGVFLGYAKMQHLRIGEGIVEIGAEAFKDCSSLQTVIFPGTIKKIGMRAFARTALESVAVPAGVTNIGLGAFALCRKLIRVALPDGLNVLKGWMFLYCESLKFVELPHHLKEIGKSAFECCKELKEIQIPMGVERICNRAFRESGLETTYIPPSVKMFGDSSVSVLDDMPFAGCKNLIIRCEEGSVAHKHAKENGIMTAKIAIMSPVPVPETTKKKAKAKSKVVSEEMSRYSFSTKDLDEYVRNGNRADDTVTALLRVEKDPTDVDGYMEAISLLYGKILNPTSDNPREVECLAWYCLKLIDDVHLPQYNRARKIQRLRLKYVKAMLLLVMGDFCGAYDIFCELPGEAETFFKKNYGWYSLDCEYLYIASELNIHQLKVLTGDEDEAFFHNNKEELAAVDRNFQKGIMYLKKGKEIPFARILPMYNKAPNPLIAVADKKGSCSVFGLSMQNIMCQVNQDSIKVRIIPAGHKEFKTRYKLKIWSHTVPGEGLEKLKNHIEKRPYQKACGELQKYIAFLAEENRGKSKYALKETENGAVISKYFGMDDGKVFIPEVICGLRIHGIGPKAFCGYINFEAIEISEGITDIGEDAFKECQALQKVDLPSTMKRIGDRAFAQTAIESLSVPEGVSYIGPGAFSFCEALRSVVLPETLTKIDGRTFLRCDSLESVNMPSCLKEIGEFAFYGCHALKEIKLPVGVERIHHGAYAASDLEAIFIPSTVEGIGDTSHYGMKNKPFTGCNNMVIHCEEGSYAMEYAKKNGIKYEKAYFVK